jgi:mRNA interferase HigB
VYSGAVRVIARGTLNAFVRNRVASGQRAAVKAQLESWYQRVAKASWKSSAELKDQYGAASILSAERVVFNIKGNDYRLIVTINYDYQVVRIKWLGTHGEYDSIDAKEVDYDKRRYMGATDSDGGRP